MLNGVETDVPKVKKKWDGVETDVPKGKKKIG